MTPETSASTLSDPVLFEQMRNGNANGFTQLYRRYHGRVLRYCVSLLSDRDWSEDIVQNVFLKLHMSQQTIRDGQSLQSWLFTVARNEAYGGLAKKKPVELTDAVVWEGESPDDALLSKERTELVNEVLQRLHIPYREVILLRVYEQLSYDEIASITGTTVPSVKSRLFKARKALVRNLQPFI